MSEPLIVRSAASPSVRAARVPAAASRRRGFAAAGGVGSFVTVLLVGVLLWWAVVLIAAPPPFLLPGPDRVARAIVAHAGDLSQAGAVTLVEILLGFAFGVVLGGATAVAMALMPWTARLILPAVVVVQALPVFAIAPVLVLWFGFGLASKVVMASLVIFFPVASSLHEGLSRTDSGLLDLARLHGATRARTFVLIRWPSARPQLIAGLKMAAGVAPIGAIIGEWVGASQGLGLMMMHANARLQTDVMFAALAVLAVIALAGRAAVDLLTRHWAPWAPDTGLTRL
ncbi:ABC transporter permease [Siculibacillus lacustris]|uniref:ABC transporter permease n=1 Tax=Siculibacillus lacustris TaxID=1549641 RepID=A0A4Q9VKN1_9HYPH|nr:ABC transporter permease [Siculibacillus lacustris]TBW35957.1 ABC transporter permease [Siculibacillus lacustris]